MNIKLLKYQKELIDNIIKDLDKVGKVGLELFTSGGKSIIGMKLIEHYVNKTNKKVMWIAPRAALNNVYTKYLDKSGYERSVECVSLNVLSRLEKILDTKSEYKEYCLIIIDEAHRLMAKNAYEQFQKELSKFNKKVKIFAMTASSYRNLDGIKSLEEITDNGPIYKYNLSDAINDNIANPVIYYGTALEYNRRCYMALDKLREKYGEIPYVKYILNNVISKLKENENDTEAKVSGFLKSKVVFDAKDGDRHIIFFSRIAELKEQKDMVHNIIKKWYSKKNININIIEYHGDLSNNESKTALRLINASPRKNTVDVVLTVDKGAESIHPENMRTIILFRGTQSIVKFTQMIGRVITLTMYNKQANYVFDFCKSVSLIGANTILVGNRELQDRTELSSDLTPEQLLSEAFNMKKQLNTENFMEVNLDQTIEELNELFDRLGTMYNMLEATHKLIDYIKDKLDIIDKDYNGNIAKYLNVVNPGMCKLYRKLQNVVMYQALAMGDTKAIKQLLTSVIGDRLYLTFRMSKEQEENIKYIKKIDAYTQDEDLDVQQLKNIALQILTDSAPTSLTRFVQQKEGLYSQIINMFTQILPAEFGCNNTYKQNLGKSVALEAANSKEVISEYTWYRWKSAYMYIRYLNVDEDKTETLGDKRYAIALQKYIELNCKSFKQYKLSGRDNNLGARVLRVLEYIANNNVENMLPLDENFALELMQNKYTNRVYVSNILNYSGFATRIDLFNHLKQRMPLYQVINKLENEPTESNLIILVNYMVKRGIDASTQSKIMSLNTVKEILENVGKNGDTTLTRYCISKLSGDSPDMEAIVKRAAKNGLGYDTIVALAFPLEAYTDAKDAVQNIDTEDENREQALKVLKTRYCRMPYATSSILTNIRMSILPKKICKAERKFIQYMSE